MRRKEPPVLIAEHSEYTTADRMTIWRHYADVAGWSCWDHGVQAVELAGPFKPGTPGTIVPAGGIPTKFVLSWVVPGNGFTDVARLALGRLHTSRMTEAVAGGTRLTHRIHITGPLAFFYARVLGPRIRKSLPASMQRLAALAALAPRLA